MIGPRVGLAGFFKIEAIAPNGRRRLLADWQPNLVTDVGLDMPGQYANILTMMAYCRLGTGSTAPAFSDTALVNQIGSQYYTTTNNTVVGASAAAPYYKYERITYIFLPGNATGNISEIGVGPAATGNLLTRALIKDLAGTPTTITKLADEQLNVTYEFRLYPSTTDWVGDVVIDGVTYTFTIRPAYITEDDAGFEDNLWCFGGQLTTSTGATVATNVGAVTGTITPLNSTQTTVTDTQHGYVLGTYFRDTTFSMSLSQFNVTGGLQAFYSGAGVSKWQGKVTPPIPKDNTKIMTLKFRLSWGRHIF